MGHPSTMVSAHSLQSKGRDFDDFCNASSPCSTSNRRLLILFLFGLSSYLNLPIFVNKSWRGSVSTTTTMQKRDTHHEPHNLNIHFNDTSVPKVAWLMSFPNSGTSYTGKLVRRATLKLTGTNYGSSNLDNSGNSAPLYEWSPSGPFQTDPRVERLAKHDGNSCILTKTHCGGTCTGCPPKQYLQTQEQFQEECLTSDFKIGKMKGKAKYDQSIVSKAIHLIRDPFDNIVSRFHLKWKQMEKHKDDDWISKHPKNRIGFRTFCDATNKKHLSQKNSTKLAIISVNGRNPFLEYRNVPCYDDFIRYVLWHKHAQQTTRKLGLDTMVLHYEDYASNLNSTVDGILGFLGLNLTHRVEEFRIGKTYRDYFDENEVISAMSLVKSLSGKDTWELLEKYFT